MCELRVSSEYTHTMHVIHTLQPCHVNIHRPKSDTCKTYDSMNVRILLQKKIQQPNNSNNLRDNCITERKLHQLKEDTALCRSSPEID